MDQDYSTQTKAAEITSTEAPVKEEKGEDFVSFIKSVITIIFVVFVILRPTFVQNYVIPSGSMIPTLRIGDQIFVSKLSFGLRLFGFTNILIPWGSPKRQEVVVFTRPDDPQSPEDDSENYIIKRVIGLPGDKLEVKGPKVFINDQPLDEPYARWDNGGIGGSFGPVTVPEGRVFLMGDNRDHSKDSRYWSDPFLEIKRLHGRAQIIYWTTDPDLWKRIGKLIR